MDSMDLISVVVPIYNVKDYLKRCVDSIRKQSYNNIEIILVDDGSNDGSEKIVDRFAEQDYRIQVVHQKNQGLSGARNSGLKVASGKYIAFIDSDDFISELFIERLYYACVKNDADMAICDYLQGDFKFIPVEHNPGLVCCFDSSEMLGQWHSKYTKVETVAWNKLYKKEIFDIAGITYPEGYYHEDVMTTHRYVYNSKRIAYVDEKLYMYYVREGAISRTVTKKRVSDIIYANKIRYAWFENHGYRESEIRLKKFTYKVLMDMYCQAYFSKLDSKTLLEIDSECKILANEFRKKNYKLSFKERGLFWAFQHMRVLIVNVFYRIYRIEMIGNLVKKI